MARPNKCSAVATLPQTRLLEMAEGFELSVRTSDSKGGLVDATAHAERPPFERVLLMREELREICRAHGLDDTGKLEQAIVDRILGKQDAPQLPGLFEDGDEVVEATGGAPTRFALDRDAHCAVLQSHIHEAWARLLGSTHEDRLRSTASECAETFPFTDAVLDRLFALNRKRAALEQKLGHKPSRTSSHDAGDEP